MRARFAASDSKKFEPSFFGVHPKEPFDPNEYFFIFERLAGTSNNHHKITQHPINHDEDLLLLPSYHPIGLTTE